MKASFTLPSCNYNIVLSKEDLEQLLKTGHITVRPNKDVPCSTSRAYYDFEKSKWNIVGEREVPNNLNFHLENTPIPGEVEKWGVQFITINLEKKEKNN